MMMADSQPMTNTDLDGADVPTPPTEVSFPATALDEATAIVERANRRLRRAGAEQEFLLTIERHEVRSVTTHEEPDASTNGDTDSGAPRPSSGTQTVDVDYIVATLNSPRITVGPWEFLAKIDHDPTSGAMLIHTNPSAEDADRLPIPESLACGHCSTKRARRHVYMLRNTETRELLTVGTQCMAPFLGLSPSALWWLDDDDALGFTGLDSAASRRAALVVDRDRALALAWAASEEGKSYAGSQSNNPTRLQVAEVLFPSSRKDSRTAARSREIAERAAGVSAETIAEIVAAAATLDPESSYGHNLQAIVASRWVSVRNLGYLVSLVAVHRRNLDGKSREEARARERAARPVAAAGLYAPEGSRISDVRVTVEIASGWTNDYGNSAVMLIMRTTATGHLLKWSSTSEAALDLDVGETVVITRATVKGLSTFNGDDQTEILRAKYTRPAEAATDDSD